MVAAHEVLVRVKAASVNPLDVLMAGELVGKERSSGV